MPTGAAAPVALSAAEPSTPMHVALLVPDKQAHLKVLCTMDDEYLAEAEKLRKEIAEVKARFAAQLAPMVAARKAKLDEAKLPSFWRHVLTNSLVTDSIEDHDADALDWLSDITIEPFEDPEAGFKIHFHFQENPHFTNRVLTKTYHLERTSKWDSDMEPVKVESTKVDWRKGKDATVEEKTKGKGKKKKTVYVPRPSFFRFFYPLGEGAEMPPAIEDSDDDDEEEEDMEELMQEDWNTVMTLKMLVLPHAVRHYTGEACPLEDEDGDDDDDEDDDDDDDDEDDSDDEDGKIRDVTAKGAKLVKEGLD